MSTRCYGWERPISTDRIQDEEFFHNWGMYKSGFFPLMFGNALTLEEYKNLPTGHLHELNNHFGIFGRSHRAIRHEIE